MGTHKRLFRVCCTVLFLVSLSGGSTPAAASEPPVLVSSVDEICSATSDPCVVDRYYDVSALPEIELADRALVVRRKAGFLSSAESLTIRAGRVDIFRRARRLVVDPEGATAGHLVIEVGSGCSDDDVAAASNDPTSPCSPEYAQVRIMNRVSVSPGTEEAPSVSVTAVGDVTTGRRWALSPDMTAAGPGGRVRLVSRAGSVSVDGPIVANGGDGSPGGEFSVDAVGDLALGAPLRLRGDGPPRDAVNVVAGGAVVVEAGINSSGVGEFGAGADIRLFAGSNVSLAGRAFLRSNGGRAGGSGSPRASGGLVSIATEGGSVNVGAGARVSTFGAGRLTGGLVIDAAGSIEVNGIVRVGGIRGGGGTGILAIETDGDVSIGESGLVVSRGIAAPGLAAEGAFRLDGVLDLDVSPVDASPLRGNAATLLADGNLTINGALVFRGFATGLAQPKAQISGCSVELGEGARIDLIADEGEEPELELGVATELVTPSTSRIAITDGAGTIEISTGENADLSGNEAEISPLPTFTVSDAFDPACACGDGAIVSPETCDDGNRISGDGCSASCQCEDVLSCPTGPQCPTAVEIVTYSGAGAPCSTNSDCIVGDCDAELERCVSATRLDIGWPGIMHGLDYSDGGVLEVGLDCPIAAPCGECSATGVLPSNDRCRCSNDTRIVCDEPFSFDTDDCGTGLCECYARLPESISAGNTPACSVERFVADISGTIAPASGERDFFGTTRALVYGGESIFAPCPYCAGDPIPSDGVRGGVCVNGDNDGETCDTHALDRTFPVPGGAGSSLDCMPAAGKNKSGAGLQRRFLQRTSESSIGSAVPCGIPPFVSYDCHCGLCSNDQSIACQGDGDCGDGGTCESAGNGSPLPDQCRETDTCEAQPDGTGICPEGADDRFCDGATRANGEGFVQCLSDADCQASSIGVDAGACRLSRRRPCFPNSIAVSGEADPFAPVVASLVCSPQTSGPGFNTVLGLPGIIRRVEQQTTVFDCGPDARFDPTVDSCIDD